MPIENEITVIEARDWINDNKKLNLIDVRSVDEFDEDSIAGFANIPLDELTAYLPDFDQRRPVLLICNDAKMSKKAYKIIKACSLKAFVIRGGLNEWNHVINPKIKKNFPNELLNYDKKR